MAGDSKEAVERMAASLLAHKNWARAADVFSGPADGASAMLLRLLAQRDAADRAGFERGVREAADVPGRASQKLRDSFGKRRGNQVDRWVADTLSAQREEILALLAPAAIDEGTQR